MVNLRLLPALWLALGLLAGCGNAEDHHPAGLVYCSEGTPDTFNPQLTTSGTTIDATSRQLYNRLISVDEQSGTFVPELASHWEFRNGGKELYLELRQGVSFHTTADFVPTRPLNADDVVFSFNRLLDTEHPYHAVGGGRYPYFQSVGFHQRVKAVHRYGDYKLGIELHQPDPGLLSDLATDFAVVLSREYAEQLSERGQAERFDQWPVGTGPFQLEQFEHNIKLRFRAHPGYWRGPVALEQLVFDITPQSPARVVKLIGGDCDIAALPKNKELAIIQGYDDLVVDTRPGLNVAFWAFNSQKPPLNDPRIRKALSLAVDQPRILEAVYGNTASASRGLLPPVSWAYDKNLPALEYNPALAKQMLRAAGVEHLSLDIWITTVGRNYNPNAVKTAELLKEDMAQVGVELRIVSYDWNLFIDRLTHAAYDSVLIGWSADTHDPDNFFTPLLTCDALVFGSNRARWCDPAFDRLIQKARNAKDQSSRQSYYRQLELELREQAPLVPLAHASRTLGKARQWQGTPLRTAGGIDFAQLSRKP